MKTESKEDWSIPVSGKIDVPDYLMPLFNKIGTQLRFHTISGKPEVLTIAHIIQITEQFFTPVEQAQEIERLMQENTRVYVKMSDECERKSIRIAELEAQINRKNEIIRSFRKYPVPEYEIQQALESTPTEQPEAQKEENNNH